MRSYTRSFKIIHGLDGIKIIGMCENLPGVYKDNENTNVGMFMFTDDIVVTFGIR